MSRRRPSQKRPQSAARPTINRKLSWTFIAAALVIFVIAQSGAGNLSTLLGVPPLDATPVIENGDAGGSQGSPQSDQAALPTVTPAPTRTQSAVAAATATVAPKPTDAPTPTANAPPTDTSPTDARPAQRASDLPTIAYAELPPEAHDTIRLIDQGGPFPFRQDGTTFQNRERLLPIRPSGYYREYTVITPGAKNRAARRIVGGSDGELYYTEDHYSSFREIIR